MPSERKYGELVIDYLGDIKTIPYEMYIAGNSPCVMVKDKNGEKHRFIQSMGVWTVYFEDVMPKWRQDFKQLLFTSFDLQFSINFPDYRGS